MSNNIPDPILRKEKYLAKIAENTAGGGSDPVILQANKNITANGIVNPDSGFDGFAKVTVDVPNTYSAADEGKVVSDGALISQVSTSVNSNDTYDTTYYNEVTVNVPNTYTAQDEGKVVDNGTLTTQTSRTVTTNDTYTTTTNNQVIVNVPNTYTVSDEGKVVDNGALVAQTAYPSTVTQNDTYDTTNYNSITVNVPSGGGSVEEKDVNFYDYDGTCVYSYTAQEFLQLTEMPANPTHERLIAQGWNWTLSDAKTYVADYSKVNIGQQYITSDGATRLYITLGEGLLKPYLGLAINGQVTIDWGDGSTPDVVTGTSTANSIFTPHTYANAGNYVISIKVDNGSVSVLPNSNTVTPQTLLLSLKSGWDSNNPYTYLNTVKKIELGDSLSFSTFCGLSNLYYVTKPLDVTHYGRHLFYGCGLRFVICNSSAYEQFHSCSQLTTVVLSKSGACGIGAFQNCTNLQNITIGSVSEIPSNALVGCAFLQSVAIPKTVRTIGYAFQNCYRLTSITVPDSVTSINSSWLYNCYALNFVKFIPQTPPTISGTYFISSLPTDCKIYVPSLVSNLYMTGTNYPNPSAYNYIGYATYTSGDALPTLTTDETYTLTWYATVEDAIAQTNPITQGNGNEVYSRATAVV